MVNLEEKISNDAFLSKFRENARIRRNKLGMRFALYSLIPLALIFGPLYLRYNQNNEKGITKLTEYYQQCNTVADKSVEIDTMYGKQSCKFLENLYSNVIKE